MLGFTFDLLHFSALIGSLIVLKFALQSIKGVYQLFLRPAVKLNKYGQYALITGATDGIGKAIAFEFALKQSINLILVSRNAERLNQTAEEIHQAIKQANKKEIKIETLAIDFDNFDAAAEQSVKQAINKFDVGILINNVGMSYSYPEFFDQLSEKTVDQLVNLNITSTLKMTHIVLPKMLAKKKGLVVNMSSASALVPSPLLLEYHCVKNFVVDFTKGLNDEYSSKGLVFQVQCPLYVTSKLSKFKRASLMIPSPRTFAQASIKAMGHSSEVVSVPYWPHAAQMAVTNLLPRFALANYIKGMHLSIRKKALKKAAETKKE